MDMDIFPAFYQYLTRIKYFIRLDIKIYSTLEMQLLEAC